MSDTQGKSKSEMIYRVKKSLGMRLLHIVFGLYFMVTLLVTLIQLTAEYMHVRQKVIDELHGMHSTFIESFKKSLWEFNTDQLRSTLLGISRINIVAGVKVENQKGKVEATIGSTIGPSDEYSVLESLKNGEIKMLRLKKGGLFSDLFEYKFPVIYNDPAYGGDTTIGYGYIYSNQSVIVERVKYGFMLIIINSVIKTLALWIIFLLVVRKLVVSPLMSFTSLVTSHMPGKNENPDRHPVIKKLVVRNDELGQLAFCFSDMMLAINRFSETIMNLNRNLEGMVKERTRQLEEKSRDIREILRFIPQGIFTFGSGLRIHKEYSRNLETIFRKSNLHGEFYSALLFGKADLSASEVKQTENIFASSMDEPDFTFRMNAHLLPTRIQVEVEEKKKTLDLMWQAILDKENHVEKILVIIRDISELQEIRHESEKRNKTLLMIGEILKMSIRRFQSFYPHASASLARCKSQLMAEKADDSGCLMVIRTLHEIKGNARINSLSWLVRVLHKAEDHFSCLKEVPSLLVRTDLLIHLEGVNQVLKEYKSVVEENLSEIGSLFDDESSAYLDSVRDFLASQGDVEILKNRLIDIHKNYLLRPLSVVLANEVKGVTTMARALGKPGPVILITGDELLFRQQYFSLLQSVITQCFKNCIDHGIEPSEERASLGKKPGGEIRLYVYHSVSSVELCIQDDGRGLPLAKLRSKGLAGKLLSEEALDEDIASLIFEQGVSTAETISDISGRGVGLDLVRSVLREASSDIKVAFTGPENRGYRPFKFIISLPGSVVLAKLPNGKA